MVNFVQAQLPKYIYYVPLPEQQIHNSFKVLYTGTGSTYHTVVSIVPSRSNIIVFYDEWEDGYEPTLGINTQSTTKIFGDGNPLNGFPPGSPTDPPLVAGKPIVLQNDLILPRNAATVLYDGRDKFGSTQSLSTTRCSWALTPGTVLADATEYYNTKTFGTFFYFPIGQNVASDNSFSLVSVCVQASQNATEVLIDKDGNGTTDVTAVINEGESYQVNGGIMSSGTVTSSKPVQVTMITGRVGGTYSSRWYNLLPYIMWDKSYYSPVGTPRTDARTDVYLFNPQSIAITVNYFTNSGSGSYSIPAKSAQRYFMPLNSSAHFHSTAKFYAIGATDMDAASNLTWDWGFTLFPETSLTNSAYVGWGPGTGATPITSNGSPVWVGTIDDFNNTTLYVDLDGNPLTGPLTDLNGNKYDFVRIIAPYSYTTIYDASDNDQTGMHVYTMNGKQIVVAWGEDAVVAGPGNPFLDVGTTVAPDPSLLISKSYTLTYDPAHTGLADVGDTILFKIKITNFTLQPYNNVTVYDTLKPNLLYKANSTTYNSIALPDDVTPNTAFPLDKTGYYFPMIPAGARDSIFFKCVVTGPLTSSSIPNLVVAIDDNNSKYFGNTKVLTYYNPTACSINFTNSGGTNVSSYAENSTIYVKVTDGDQNTNTASIDSVKVSVTGSGGDSEEFYLLESGVNTGIFGQASHSLASSKNTGTGLNDGTLHVNAGNTINVTYADVINGGTCTQTNLPITGPSYRKYLYLCDSLSATSLDRIKPWDGLSATSAVIGSGSSGSANLTPIADALISAANPTNNYGAAAWFAVEGSTSSNRSLLKFSFSAYVGYTITSASLSMRRPDSSPATMSVDAHKVTNPWAEGSGTATWAITDATIPASGTTTNVSWTNRTGTTPWTTAGGDFGPVVSTTTIGTGTVSLTGLGTMVQAWVNDTATNYGMLIKETTESGAPAATTRDDFYNRTDGTASNRPSLTINYTSPGVPSVTFSQRPSMCSNLNLPTGGTVKVKLWIVNQTGTMIGTGSKAITVNVKNSGTTFLTMSSGTFTDNAGTANDTIIFTGTLASNVTINAAGVVSLEIGSLTGGLYQISYDASTVPSMLRLPVTNVIDVTSLLVYNAPYSGGTAQVSGNNGNTYYIRATVSDPFGNYDVHDAVLRITDPLSNSVDVAMTRVDTAGCIKTFEYAWPTGGTQGIYTLRVIATEGYENEVRDTSQTTFKLQYLDTGTPCSSDFTDNTYNSAVNQYNADGTLYIKVQDLDKNSDPLTTQTVTVVVTSSTGDSENLTLTESGNNTGIFQNSLVSSTSLGTLNNDGTLYASNGATIFFTYTDNATSSDVCTDNAFIFTAAPALSTIKTRLLPSSLYAKVGDTVRWQITVTNPGNLNLADIAMTDTYSSGCLTFLSASPVQSSTGVGTITWNTAAMGGSLLIGQTRTFTVTFLAASGCGSITNSVTATSVANALTSTATSPVTLDDPKLTIVKSRLTPPNDPVFVGAVIPFQIVVTNTGTTTASTVPLIDTYSDYNFSFSSASPPESSAGAGQVNWDNIGPIAPLGSVTVNVSFTALHGNEGNYVINNASVDFATDEHGNLMPSVNDSARLVIFNPPVANNDSTTTIMNTAVSGIVMANDYDDDGDNLTVTTPNSGTAGGIGGTYTINGSGVYTYTPPPNTTGVATFTYQICDPTGACDTATVKITVLPCLNPPTRPDNIH